MLRDLLEALFYCVINHQVDLMFVGSHFFHQVIAMSFITLFCIILNGQWFIQKIFFNSPFCNPFHHVAALTNLYLKMQPLFASMIHLYPCFILITYAISWHNASSIYASQIFKLNGVLPFYLFIHWIIYYHMHDGCNLSLFEKLAQSFGDAYSNRILLPAHL